jgi:hypothetical protein
MKPPAGVEPAPRPYKGRVLAVDTTEAKVETAGLEPASPRCKRGALVLLSYVPKVRTGGVESGYAQRYHATGLQPAELADAQRPHEGDRPDSNRYPEVHNLGCSPLHHGHHENGDDRIRTGGLSPDKRSLLPLSYAPEVARVGFEPTVSSS